MLKIVFGLMLGLWLSLDATAGADLPDRCRLEPVRGSCKALFENYAFDQERRKCLPIFSGGCGIVPFEELEECEALCEIGDELRISELRQVEGLPFARLDLEYPKAWTEPAFVVRVNGRDAATRSAGGGFSQTANLATLEVFLGSGPVTGLSAETTVEGKVFSASATLHWVAAPEFLLIGHFGRDEALLEAGELRFLMLNVDSLSVRHNGIEIGTEAVKGPAGAFAVWRVEPKWSAGRNVLAVTARAGNGARLEREYSFVNLADGRLPLRQKTAVVYGEPGSRSGPFYRLDVVGDAIAKASETIIDVPGLDDAGWPAQHQKLIGEIAGSAPGAAVLRIFNKPHFRGSEQIEREIRLQVAE